MIAHRVLLFQLKGLQDALPRDGLLAIVSLLATERKQVSLSVDDPHVKLVRRHNVQRGSLRIDQPASHVTGPLDALILCHLTLQEFNRLLDVAIGVVLTTGQYLHDERHILAEAIPVALRRGIEIKDCVLALGLQRPVARIPDGEIGSIDRLPRRRVSVLPRSLTGRQILFIYPRLSAACRQADGQNSHIQYRG